MQNIAAIEKTLISKLSHTYVFLLFENENMESLGFQLNAVIIGKYGHIIAL